jgi:hypothetical protein
MIAFEVERDVDTTERGKILCKKEPCKHKCGEEEKSPAFHVSIKTVFEPSIYIPV